MLSVAGTRQRKKSSAITASTGAISRLADNEEEDSKIEKIGKITHAHQGAGREPVMCVPHAPAYLCPGDHCERVGSAGQRIHPG